MKQWHESLAKLAFGTDMQNIKDNLSILLSNIHNIVYNTVSKNNQIFVRSEIIMDQNFYSLPPKKADFGWSKFFLVLLAVAVVFSFYQNGKDQALYTAANKDYLAGNCGDALTSYNELQNAFRLYDFGGYVERSIPDMQDCQAFLPGVEKSASDPSGGILIFSDFLNNYPQSNLLPFAQQRVEDLFRNTDAGTLGTTALCNQLVNLTGRGLVPQPSQTLPSLYYQCGLTYERDADLLGAITMLDRIGSEYPQNPINAQVETALARVLVAYARQEGGGEIPEPNQNGLTSDGSTLVEIQNDSPEKLRIVFSGPESRVEVLEACGSCQNYSVVGPLYCPEKGPIGRYTVPAGSYDVVVQAMTDSSISPWNGTWSLNKGEKYSSCFYITTTFAP